MLLSDKHGIEVEVSPKKSKPQACDTSIAQIRLIAIAYLASRQTPISVVSSMFGKSTTTIRKLLKQFIHSVSPANISKFDCCKPEWRWSDKKVYSKKQKQDLLHDCCIFLLPHVSNRKNLAKVFYTSHSTVNRTIALKKENKNVEKK